MNLLTQFEIDTVQPGARVVFKRGADFEHISIRVPNHRGMRPARGSREDGERIDAVASYRAVATDIAALRPADREILLLHAWAELSDREIAQALGLPIGTVKSRLHRMRERLRNRIERDGQPDTNRPLAITPEEHR